MAPGDKYFNCNNKELGIISLLKSVVKKDANDKPYFNSNASFIEPDPAFKITVKTNNAGTSSATQFTLPLVAGKTYNAIIDWGDGSTTNQLTATSPTHTYSVAGTYQISITGIFPSLRFANGIDKLKLLSIDNWGTIQWLDLTQSFYGCTNLIGTYTDKPDFSLLTSALFAFNGCASFNSEVDFNGAALCASYVGCFYGCTIFNKNVTFEYPQSLQATFQYCINFNSVISINNNSRLTTTLNMLNGCVKYNKPYHFEGPLLNSISGCFIGNSTLNSNITFGSLPLLNNASSLLGNCLKFNKPLDLTSVPIGINVTGLILNTVGLGSFNSPLIFNKPTSLTQILVCQGAGVSVFNNTITVLDSSLVTSVSQMLEGNKLYNLPITFDLPNCINFSFTFNGCDLYNQPTFFNFTTTSTFKVTGMFQGAIAFDQNIANWNMSKCNDGFSFMAGKSDANYSASNLDAIYNTWSALSLITGKTFNFGTIKYTVAGSAGRSVLTSAPKNWTLIDGGI